MARILISEPHADVRRMLERMLDRLGYEPVTAPHRIPTSEQFLAADAYLLEPYGSLGATMAQAAHIANPALPLISIGSERPPADLAELGVTFAAVLLKPFTLSELGAALAATLAGRRARCA